MQAKDRIPPQRLWCTVTPGNALAHRSRQGKDHRRSGLSLEAARFLRAALAVTLVLAVGLTSYAQFPPPLPTNPGGPPSSLPPATPAPPRPAPGSASPSGPSSMGAQPGRRPKLVVSDILVQGNRHQGPEYIRNLMKTQVGREFDSDQLQEDVRALYNTRQFGTVWADKQEDGPGRIRIIVHIRDYPTVVEKVTYQGNIRFRISELEDATGIRQGMPCNPMANKVGCRRIVAKYNDDGYPLASCDLLKGTEAGDSEVIFNITEGPRVRVGSIQFRGNQFASDAMLRTHIQSSSKFLGLPVGGIYNASVVDHDLQELVRYYRSFGYHDVKVAKQLIYAPDGREVSIVIHIQEGVRYKVSDTPQVDGVKSVPAEALEAMSKMKGGQYYNQSVIDGDLGRVREWVNTQGREARVGAIPVFNKDKPGIVQVRYEVEERPPAKVGQIFIVGNERTKQNVILRQVPLYPGQVLNYNGVREAERNLARLNIFETSPDGAVRPTVTILDNPIDPDGVYKDVLVNVQETSTGSLMFGLGVNSDSGLTGSIILNERNFDLFRVPTSFDDFLNGTAFRGAGQEFRVEAVPGTQLQRYVVSFREPFLFDSPYSLTVSGYYYQRFFNEYSEERLGGRFSLGRKVSDYWSVVGTVRLENVDVGNVSIYAPQDYQQVKGTNFLAGFRGGVVRDSRDSIVRPTEGSLIDLSFEQVIGDYNFPLVSADLSQYFTAYQRADGTGRHVVSLHSQVGWAGSNTPVMERFFGGGFRSIRGFQFRGVGPDINGFKVGGDFMLLNSVEYQVPVTANDQVNLVAFVDSGTISPKIDNWDEYRVSVGFGVRFVVPMLGPVPIALDFGFPVVSAASDNKQVFNFFMGWTR